MYRFIEFIRSVYVVVLFVIIEIVAVSCYVNSSVYANAKVNSYLGGFTGGVYSIFSDSKSLFSLPSTNRALVRRIADLENELSAYKANQSVERPMPKTADSLMAQYYYTTARVVSNSVNNRDNFMVIDKGLRDGVRSGMALLSPEGDMVGYVVAHSDRYAVALSILSDSFKASGKVSGDGHFGSIRWSGTSSSEVSLVELSKYAKLKKGAQVVSTGYSLYFPEGARIGKIESFEMNNTNTAYSVKLRLNADMSALKDVIVVRNLDYEEQSALLDSATVGDEPMQ